jgi:hypothetical protein
MAGVPITPRIELVGAGAAPPSQGVGGSLRCWVQAIARDDAAYIMDTFPIARRRDEARFGEYSTKRAILEMYDAL